LVTGRFYLSELFRGYSLAHYWVGALKKAQKGRCTHLP